MCSKEAFPFHLIYLKFPFFLPVPAPDGLHIIQVAGSCLCFWQAKAKDLLCVISWTPGVALQITKRDARFLHSCHFHIFSPIIYSPHMGNFWPIFITFRVCWDKRLCLWTGWLFQLPQGSPSLVEAAASASLQHRGNMHLPPHGEVPHICCITSRCCNSNNHPENTVDENPGVLGCMEGSVASRLRWVILPLCLALVITQLEWCIQLCGPRLRKDMDLLEPVQRGATKMGSRGLVSLPWQGGWNQMTLKAPPTPSIRWFHGVGG